MKCYSICNNPPLREPGDIGSLDLRTWELHKMESVSEIFEKSNVYGLLEQVRVEFSSRDEQLKRAKELLQDFITAESLDFENTEFAKVKEDTLNYVKRCTKVFLDESKKS